MILLIFAFLAFSPQALAADAASPMPAAPLTGADEGPMMCPLQELRVARCSPVALSQQEPDEFPVKQILVCQTEKKEYSLMAKVVVNGELKKMGPIPAAPTKNSQTGRVEFLTKAGTAVALAPDRTNAAIRHCVPLVGPPPEGPAPRELCEGRTAVCQ
ncbi:MAG: hypothetical protein HUU37_01785 [Bdellovibrionales bacterium]|nr:hypothetical protein [Bdellovibrionales bacterium]